MTPDEARDLFSAAYEGELSPEQRASFDALLAEDAALRTEYEGFCSTIGGMRSLGAQEPPRVDVLSGVQKELRRRSRGRYYRDRFAAKSAAGRWTPMAIGVAMLLVLAVAWMALHFAQVEPEPPREGPAPAETGAPG